VGELPLDARHCSHEQRASLQSMLHSLSATIGDASLAKDVAAAAGHVQAMANAAGQPQQQLEQAALEELVSRVCRLSLSTLPALPGALGEAAAAAAAGGTAAAAAAALPRGAAGGRKTAAAGPARVAGKGRASAARASAAAASSNGSDDATDEGATAAVRLMMPAAARRRLASSSSRSVA
jgi:hypothetical protein